MGVSLDGFVSDREGHFAWTAPTEELFSFHLEQTRGLGCYLLGRHLYEAMRVWETDPALRETPQHADFADVWTALPKVVFSRSLDRVEGNARLAEAPLAEEVTRVLASTDRDVAIGGAEVVRQALTLDLVDELNLLRHPVLVGGGNPLFPPVEEPVQFDLVESRVYAPRVVLERYRRARG